MRKIATIVRRELLSHVRKPAFYLATLTPPLLLAIVVLVIGRPSDAPPLPGLPAPGSAGAGEQARQPFGYVDHSGAIQHVPPFVPTELARAFGDEQTGLAALNAGQIQRLFVLPADYPASGEVLYYTADDAEAPGDLTLLRQLLRANFVPRQQDQLAQRLEQPMQLRTVAVSPAARLQGGDAREEGLAMLAPVAFAMLLSLSIFSSSSILLQGVVEEKENRTIEVIISSLGPRQFLTGKVLGLGLVGLLQLIIWTALAQLVLGSGAELVLALRSVELPAVVWALLLVYFVLGYLLFAALMAAIGAVSTSMRETSQLAVAVSLPAAAPILLIMPLVAAPNGWLALVLSLFPLTAPISMVVRQTVTVVPVWQVALSLLLLLLTVLGALWLAGRLFRAATLLTGQRLSVREIVRALRG